MHSKFSQLRKIRRWLFCHLGKKLRVDYKLDLRWKSKYPPPGESRANIWSMIKIALDCTQSKSYSEKTHFRYFWITLSSYWIVWMVWWNGFVLSLFALLYYFGFDVLRVIAMFCWWLMLLILPWAVLSSALSLEKRNTNLKSNLSQQTQVSHVLFYFQGVFSEQD